MKDAGITLSLDLLRAIYPTATEDMTVEFDANGTLHLIQRDDDGNDVKDVEVLPKTIVDTSDIPSMHERIESTRKKALKWKVVYCLCLGALASLLALAVTVIKIIGV